MDEIDTCIMIRIRALDVFKLYEFLPGRIFEMGAYSFLLKFGEDRKKIKKIYFVAVAFSLLFPVTHRLMLLSTSALKTLLYFRTWLNYNAMFYQTFLPQ